MGRRKIELRRKRNVYAAAVTSNRVFKQRVVNSNKAYNRKHKHQKGKYHYGED